jgi:hypothetical protein
MYKKIYFILIAVIIIVIFTLSNRYVDIVVNTLVPNVKQEITQEIQVSTKNYQETISEHSRIQGDNQYLSSNNVSSINRQALILTPKAQCTRPENLALTNQYFQLNTNVINKSDGFTLELKNKLNAAFKHIEKLLSIELNETILLTMFFSNTEEGYEALAQKYNRNSEGTQGIYISYYNVSLIKVNNYEQGIKTGIHEAIHALNYAYFGYTLRFINEGMAEYYEAISERGDIPLFDFTWLKHRQYPEQISTILFSKTDWHGVKTHDLYQQSKALFYFLMSNRSGRKVIWKILAKEMKDPCTVLSEDDIEQLLFENYPNHQQEFDYWFEEGLYRFLNPKV